MGVFLREEKKAEHERKKEKEGGRDGRREERDEEERGDEGETKSPGDSIKLGGNAYTWDPVIKSIKRSRWSKEANTETGLG